MKRENRRKRIRKAPGASPGTLLYTGPERAEKLNFVLMDYSPDRVNEKVLDSVEQSFPFLKAESVTWLHVEGIHDVNQIASLGQFLGLHPLTLEDILNTGHRPKMEEFPDYLFLLLHVVTDEKDEIKTEQVSIILAKNIVVTFVEGSKPIFEPVRERIRSGGYGRIRRSGADYLAYALLDTVVDNYFSAVESLGDRIEDLEGVVVRDPAPEVIEQVYALRNQTVVLRRAVWPLREVVTRFERIESKLVSSETAVFTRDVYDHTIHVLETLETFRDQVSGLIDLYLSSLSHRMNQVMKVLTIIATIFIPLTFVAGIYGMNFEYMPELKSPWGYPATLLVMLTVGVSMVLYFRRRNWL